MKFKLRVDALLSPDGYELLSAAKANNVERARAVLTANPALVYYKSVFGGQTAWHQAALHGSAAVLEELSKCVQMHKDRLSKGLAAKAGCLQANDEETWAEHLARTVNQENNRQQTPLMLAAAACHPEAAHLLLQYGADVHARDSGSRTALHYAAYSGCSSCCAQLVTAAQAEASATARAAQFMARYVDKRTICGLTALHYASYYNHLDCAQQLLHAGASLLARCTWSGAVENIWCDPQCTPLHLAARHVAPAMAKLLLQALVMRVGSPDIPRNIDPRNQRDRAGRLPLHYVSAPDSPIVHLLHPDTSLSELFGPGELAALLVEPEPSLAQLAAAAHRSFLRSRIQALAPAAARAAGADEAHTEGSHAISMEACSAPASGMALAIDGVTASERPLSGPNPASSTSPSSSRRSSSIDLPASTATARASRPALRAQQPPPPAGSAPAAAAPPKGEEAVAEGQCGVCWAQAASLELQACQHQLCVACSLKICAIVQEGPPRAPSCPFCRAAIRDVRGPQHTPWATACPAQPSRL